MIEFIHEDLQDLSSAMCKSYANYPTESTEYIWMMQDLSRGQFKAIIPNVEFSDSDTRQYFVIVRDAPTLFRRVFFVHYIARQDRRKKMKWLKTKDKNYFYSLRDQLHCYVLGALTSLDKKSVRTISASERAMLV